MDFEEGFLWFPPQNLSRCGWQCEHPFVAASFPSWLRLMAPCVSACLTALRENSHCFVGHFPMCASPYRMWLFSSLQQVTLLRCGTVLRLVRFMQRSLRCPGPGRRDMGYRSFEKTAGAGGLWPKVNETKKVRQTKLWWGCILSGDEVTWISQWDSAGLNSWYGIVALRCFPEKGPTFAFRKSAFFVKHGQILR